MVFLTDPVETSHGFVQLVNKTATEIVLSGQFISREYRKLAIYCIKRSTNLFNYSRGLRDSCAPHQRLLLHMQVAQLNTSFLGYVWTDKNSRIFVGFVESRNESGSVNSEEHDQYSVWWSYARVAFCYLIYIVYTMYNPAMLALFCPTDITVHTPDECDSSMERHNRLQNGDSEHDRFTNAQDGYQDEELTSLQLTENEGTRDNTGGADLEVDEADRMTVRLINVGGLSPKGFRSLIANNLFSKNSNSKCRKTVKLALLVLFPLSFSFLGDLYFRLLMPRLFSKIVPDLPPRYLTESVFYYAYEKCPYMLICFFFYAIRCLFLCFTPATSIWVPSFVCRKHLRCAISNNYCFQHIIVCFPAQDPACDECKTTADCPKQCEVPENIKHNLQVQTQIFVKHWKYVYGQLLYECRMQQAREQNRFWWVISFVLLLVTGIIKLGIYYVLIVAMDIMFSSPIVSLCYGRMWITGEWLEHKSQFHYRIFRFIACHVPEFLLICSSVAWVTYFSFCTSLVVETAITGVMSTLKLHPMETIKYLSISTILLKNVWDCYRSFTGKYDDLTVKLFKSYKESYKKNNHKLINYKHGDVIAIPKDLFDKACVEMMPLDESVFELISRVIVVSIIWVGFYGLLISIEDSTVGLINFLLSAFSSAIYLFVGSRISTEKDRENVVSVERASNIVDDYISRTQNL
ncbi:hypothetical protein OS493_014795 [Desmophyllum pertusum]|uniref:Uncharacterized protein n=1 Tax=Desmophyllum pertusum TaxID=174260 RepID=A0A9W9YD73_9CNID|nr:hypothetical protein OS493_014795 [Desmophyllum pertusum]